MRIVASIVAAAVGRRFRGTAAALHTLSVTSLEKLPVEIFDEVLKYLDTNTLTILERTSPGLCETVQIYKEHCCKVILARYAMENSLFASSMDNGWLVTTEVHAFKGLQWISSPRDGQLYYSHIRMYASNLRRLSRFSVLLCFEKGYRLNPASMYQAILVWSVHGWTQMSQLQLEAVFLPGVVMPGVQQVGGRACIPVTALPASLVAFFQERAERLVI